MKEIFLTQGKVTIVNNTDYVYLMQWLWRFNNKGYAERSSRKSESLKRKHILMHRVILSRKLGHSNFVQTDHKNRNGLDNRRSNLRPAKGSQNNANVAPIIGSSKFKGVCWHKRDKRWRARIVLKR